MYTWPVKDPNAKLPYGFDWTEWLASLAEGETIASSTFTVVTGTVEIEDTDVVGGTTVVVLSGGAAGETCTITNHVITSSGYEDDRTARQRIRQR